MDRLLVKPACTWHLTSDNCHVQNLEVEIIPRLEKLVCRLQEPDEDDVNLLQAPVGGSPLLPTDEIVLLLYALREISGLQIP